MQDSILFWNAVALEANRVSHSDPDKRQQNGPTLSSRAIAIVHLAMYDAYAGIVGGAFPRYLNPAPPPPVPPPALSARDAVAGAAHRTLSMLYSSQAVFFDAQLSCFDTDSDSFIFGLNVGQALLNMRANDMDARDCGYIPSPKRGRHRRDPDNPGQGFNSPFYGAQMRTFAVSTRHDLDEPFFDNGANQKYRRALRDVRARGIRPDLTATLPTTVLFNRRRTPEDTLVGIYWGYDGANRLGTPPRLYNQIIRQVAMTVVNPTLGRIHNEGDNARLFAFVNAALGDAGILAWEQKYCWDFWRPVIGIREHDRTLGPIAPHGAIPNVNFDDGDPGWLPLGAPSTNSPGMKNFTPDFPAYPSGHATFGAAAFHITRMFYGRPANNKNNDTLFPGFFISDEFNGGNRDNDGTVRPRHTRFFPGGLWGMILENAISRVLLGVHWIFDAFDFSGGDNGPLNHSLNNERIGGVGLGLRIARDIFAHGNNGLGPQMTPNDGTPPIMTPAARSPMPTRPAQPAEVPGCAGPAVDQPPAQSVAPTKKGATKGSAKRGATKKGATKKTTAEGAAAAEASEQPHAWPTGISEQDGAPPSVSGAWPSGISEK
jgi:membrane-associated phospholipid phosphatase